MLKRYCLLFSVLIAVLYSTTRLPAQGINWSTGPKTGFVFQISNDEAQKLLTKSRPDTIINALLHSRIDTFNVEKGWTRRPDKGHFILARIIENKLHCEYASVFPYEVLLLKEYNALSLQVLDFEGNVRRDARVKLKTRRIRFDKSTNTYRIENNWFNGTHKFVTVELDGFRSVFNIERREAPSWTNDYYSDDNGPDFYSYLITDKNKYKPGERVRFKSYALTGSKNPIRKDLDVWLLKMGRPIKVATVSPHRPGSFAGEFILHDSLRLALDQHYTLQLWDKNKRVVSSCLFKYEDYEIHGNKLEIALETNAQYFPASNFLKIKATNENGLMLKDARATVVVMTEQIREVFQSLVILPDTLLFKEIALDPDQETVIEIPSSVFQKSNTSYAVVVAVLNTERRRMEATAKAVHYFSEYEVNAKYSSDSVAFEILDKGVPLNNTPATIFRDDSDAPVEVLMPHKEKINQALKSIRIESNLVSRSFMMENMLPRIEILGGIKKDSFNVSILNPQKVVLSWFIYQGNVLLKKGSGSDLDFKSSIDNRNASFYVELLYSFGGSDHVVSKEFEFLESALNIALDLPERVYPGQKVDANIQVTDDEGNPVSGVDLTAFATTAKLNYYLPNLPYYGSRSQGRAEPATFSKTDVNKRVAILPLNYEKWVPICRLDTMKYYQFTYPGNQLFRHEVKISDSTQFAPYVMQNGIAKQIQVVEIDHRPVYFAWANHVKGNSFYVAPSTYKEIALRLHDRVIIVDSLCFEKGVKTIFSLDMDHLPEGVRVQKIPRQIVKTAMNRTLLKWSLTGTELQRFKPYVAAFTVHNEASYLFSHNSFVPLTFANNGARVLIAGPVPEGIQSFVQDGVLQTTYKHAGGYAYSFEDNIVYKTDPPKLFPEELANLVYRPMNTINDLVTTKEKLLERHFLEPTKWHPRIVHLVDHACRIRLLLPEEKAASGVATVVFQGCKTKAAVFPCKRHYGGPDFFTIPRGCYHAILLYNNGTFLKTDEINIKSNSNIVADMGEAQLHQADSASLSWILAGSTECFSTDRPAVRTIRMKTTNSTTGNVRGTVLDDTNLAMPGVNIVVKGTMIGTVSDVEGHFYLDVPEDPSILVISFIGYMTQEIEVRAGSDIAVVLQPDVQQLSEVVVVGYGANQSKDITGSVARLQGRVSGVTLSEKIDDDFDTEEKRDQSDARDAEQKLYQELLTLRNIRSDFSDVGFWEPRLATDRHGRCTFSVTFPDDLTRWDAIVYGMNRHLQTGTVRKSIKSYKPIVAELHVPQFLTVGDSSNFIGKIVNYTSDSSMSGKSSWAGATSIEHDIHFDSYHKQDRLTVATTADTITTRFSFTRSDGYFDGEERKVPVVEQGTIRANGSVEMLKNGDEVHIASRKGAQTNVKIFDSQLDVYASDVRNLMHYRYDCNEQLASKLIALVNARLIAQYEGNVFKYDNDVKKIIARLLKNQNSEFLWSWWDVSPNTSYWMSAHILRALKAAKDAGYVVDLDISNVTRKATYKYDFLNDVSLHDVQLLHALATWNAEVDYDRYVRILDKNVQKYDSIRRAHKSAYRSRGYSLLNEKLMLLEIRQLQQLPMVRDSLLKFKKESIMHEIHFDDDEPARYWYSDDLSNNAIAYRIVSRDSVLRDLTTPMQMYFLSLRKKGGWNTYEASTVLMSILPDLITQGSSKTAPAEVLINGKVSATVTKFPYSMKLMEGEQVTIRKTAGLPLYCMQYMEERVTTAQSGTDALKVKTELDKKKMKAGTPTILKVTVEVKRDATLQHVMIEIPIPGACSYSDKRQFDNRIETHREYFKDRTVIFCENMTAGTYLFQVQLLPRFTGSYNVNPAQVSLMYFPVINANTDMHRVEVHD